MVKALHDIRLLYVDSMRHSFKNPIFIFLSLFQPLMFMLLYMPLLGGLGNSPGFSGGTVNTFIPGLAGYASDFRRRLCRFRVN